MSSVATSPAALLQLLAPSLQLVWDTSPLVASPHVEIVDIARLRREGAATIAWSAAFSGDSDVVAAAQWLARATAKAVGIESASIAPLYAARASGGYEGLTVPALNLRSQVFDMSRTALELAASIDGAGWWRRLTSITIPLLLPTFTIIFVLAAGVLGEAEASLIYYGVTDAGPEGAGRLIGRYAYEVAFLQGDLRWGYAAAMNLTVGLTSMAISGLVFRVLRSGRV